MLTLFIIIPVVTALLLMILPKSGRALPDILAAAATLALSLLSAVTLMTVLEKGYASYALAGLPAPLGVSLFCDGFSALFLVTVNLLSLLVAVYSSGYMEKSHAEPKFYFFFMTLLAGLNGVLLSGDIFTSYVFIELTAISAYLLTSFEQKAESFEAAFKYAVLGSVSSALILFAIALLYSKSASLSYFDLAASLQTSGHGAALNLITILFITGFGLKATLVPFHTWAPDAYASAPAPASAMFSGAVGKVLGIYMLSRLLFNVIGATAPVLYIIASLGTLSIVIGVTLALYQWDLKRLLAYHSISQIGYIMLGIGLGTPLGIMAGLFHLVNHTAFKSLLFFNAGSIERATGKKNLKELGGLSKVLPVTASTSMMASLSISGVPPFNGFWSKLLIIIACVTSQNYWFALFAVLASILTLASFMKVQRYAFYGYLKDSFAEIKEAPLTMTVPMIVLALLCLFMGCLLLPGIDGGFLGIAMSSLTGGIQHFSILTGALK